MAIESNIAVLTSLRSFYQDLINNDSFSRRIPAASTSSAPSTASPMSVRNPMVLSSAATVAETEEFAKELATLISNLKMQVLRAKHLSQMMSSRKELVSNIAQGID